LLWYNNYKTTYLIGVVSYPGRCTNPTVYAKVTSVLKWILELGGEDVEKCKPVDKIDIFMED
jgi:hypothetical protein